MVEFSSPVTVEKVQQQVKAVILSDDHEILRDLRLKLQKSLKEQEEREEGLLDEGFYESEDSDYMACEMLGQLVILDSSFWGSGWEDLKIPLTPFT